MKESPVSTPNWISPLFCVCLTLSLSACNIPDGNNSSANTDTSTIIGGEIGKNPAEPGPSPSDDTSSPALIELSWQANPGEIDGYMVHTGPTPELATTVVTVTPNTTVEYDPVVDLGLNVGDQACFRIKAYNAEGQSDFSDAVCYTISTRKPMILGARASKLLVLG